MHLNFKSFGERIPVVILHGLLGSLDNWQTFARRLSSEFKVYTVDQRNHGKSPHSEVHTYSAMVSDLIEFFDEHHIDQAHLIGHSMGGKVAMQFAISHSARVLKLILVDISPRSYESGHDVIFEALMQIDLSKIKKREEAEVMLSEKIHDAAVRRFLLKNLDRVESGFVWKMNLDGFYRNYENINVPIQSDSEIDIPTILIRGAKSNYVQESDLKTFREIFPSTKLVTIPNAGHWVHADAPDKFYEVVKKELSL